MNYRVFACCLLLSFSAQAQVQLEVRSSRGSAVQKLNYKPKQNNHALALQTLKELLGELQYRGYLLAEADTIIRDSTRLVVEVRTGDQYRSARLRIGNLDPGLAARLGISEKLFLDKPFRYREVARSIEKIIGYYENHGYPFTVVKLDSVQVDSNRITAAFNVDKGRYFKIDSILVIGSARLSDGFIRRYLDIKPGMPYREQELGDVSKKIRQLPFVNEKQAQRVELSNQTNRLLLFLDKKNASQFDGILGLLPDANTKKTVITGDVKLKLVNSLLHSGETFDLEWRRLQSQTQDFQGRMIYPYLFGSPLGGEYGLKIYRRDTTFIDVNNNLGAQYYLKGLNHFRIFYRQRNSSLISTSGLDFVTVLPEYADITMRSYGAGFMWEDLDYRFNPRQGVFINLSAQTGDRLIRKNPNINELAYRDLLLRTTQYQAEGAIALYLPLARLATLKLGVQGGGIANNSRIFRNELFRIGGLKTLRGFDEESIFASAYVIPTIEYRFLFAPNSNILVFAEGAWYENNSSGQYSTDRPVSVGAGINFETRAGIFSMNYALGNQQNNGFDLRNGKIHFGLTALF